MNILVTGGAGFIGSHIVDAYLQAGHRVWVVDDLSTGNEQNLNPGARFFKADISQDDLEPLFGEGRFDVINHHAAQINVRKSLTDPLFDARVNIMGTLRLLQAATRHGIKRWIFASSGGAVYGEPGKYPISEDRAPVPMSPYAVAKLAAEQYLLMNARLKGFATVILRYSNVYGPRQISKSEAGVISIFIDRILHGASCRVNGDGRQTRDYVYVGDVVAANRLALEAPAGCYNIGTGVETSVNDLIDILGEVVGRPVSHEHVPAIPGEVLRNALDSSLARSRLSWNPATAIRQGIGFTFDYFRNAS